MRASPPTSAWSTATSPTTAIYYGAGADVAVTAGIEVQPVVPSEDEWNDGTQDGFCVAVSAEGGTATGSIKGEGPA